MAELARGTTADRPWGRTLAALGLKGLTGQLTLSSDGRQYCIAFTQGAVVGATSPLPNDAAVRVALTGHLVTSTQVPEIARRQAASPDRDEIEVIAELARLGPEQMLRLRRRVVAQRAARTFSIDRGEFVVADEISIPVVPGSEIDIRALIYLGARQNLSEQRLASELGQLGQWFLIKPDALEDLPQYGFSEAERPVVELLRIGADLGELEHVAPGVEQRMVRAAVYALASCNACAIEPVPRGRAETRAVRASTHPDVRSGRISTQPGRRTTDATPRVTRDSIRPPDTRVKPGSTPPSDVHTRTTRQIEPTRTGAATASPPARSGGSGSADRANPVDEQSAVRFKPISGQPVAPPPAPPDDAELDPARTRTQTDPALRMRQLVDPPRDDRSPTRAASGSQPPPAESRAPTVPRTTSPSGPIPSRTSSDRTPSGPVPSRTSSDRTPSSPIPSRTTSPSGPVPARTATPSGAVPSGSGPTRTVGSNDKTPSGPVPRTTSMSRPPGRPSSGPIKVPLRARTSSSSRDVEQLIRDRLALVDQRADHFALLGIAQTATPEQIRAAYYGLARQLHPDRLASLGVEDPERDAHRLFAQVNTAFAILSDVKRKRDYVALLSRGGESAVAQEQAKADDVAKRAMSAEEAYRRGEMAMRRDQIAVAIEEFRKAIELNKDEADYHAMLAWAQFCGASDKAAVATDTRIALERAIGRSSPKAVTAHFYLGRVERMLGRDQDALRHFMDVLSIAANHTEARSEIRAIQARLASKPPEKGKNPFGRSKPNSRR